MRNINSKTAKKAKKKTAARPKVKNIAALREQITDMVKGHAVGMVDTTIAEADKGHFAAMKYLFEMIGLYPLAGEEEPEVLGDSVLAKTLIRRLGLQEEGAEAARSAGRTGEISQASSSSADTVE
jgi:hypothetical protein